MSESADELIEAAIRDAKLALTLLNTFMENWTIFAQSCQSRKMEVADIYGQRCVGIVESAVDLYAASHRRIHLYEKILKEPSDG